jgi:hypothetical protein
VESVRGTSVERSLRVVRRASGACGPGGAGPHVDAPGLGAGNGTGTRPNEGKRPGASNNGEDSGSTVAFLAVALHSFQSMHTGVPGRISSHPFRACVA